jgi:prolyl-tRNA synthetase
MRGIEVGHIFKLGTLFSEKMGALFLGPEGEQKLIVMGCYGIGVGRMLAAAIEQNHDDQGIIWPTPIAPYQVYLCALGMDKPEVAASADKLYADLEAKGIEVLFDDRLESPGVKFNDADLLGIPLRVVISPRTLKLLSAEIKWRAQKESQLLPLEGIAERIKKLLVA